MPKVPAPKINRAPVSRVSRACNFCRQRKMKCTGERPRCKNCEVYDEECVFAGPVRKPRPTNAALDSLREENRRLREQSGAASHDNNNHNIGTSPQDQVIQLDHEQHSEGSGIPSASSSLPERSLPESDPVLHQATTGETPRSVGGTTYHGPTSTLFDEATVDRQSQSWLSREREAWMPKLLVAAAAEQRQMENINARAGKLDFDGVDPELAMHLLQLHWNRQHHSFLVTYRPAFMRDMAVAGPCFSKILLNAIYYGASKFSPRLELRKDPDDVRTAGWRFRNRVRDLLGSALDHSEITTIQALLQMSNSLFALGDEQSAAWVYAGTAFRMLVDLGLHVDATMLPNMHRLSDEDIEIRRRVYWAAFVVDKMQSLYQGRPASLRAQDCQVPITFLDTYEELEDWHPFAYTSSSYAGSPSYSVSTFKELCKLCIIMQDVLDKMYCEGKKKHSAENLVCDLEALEQRLQEWMMKLPDHLRLRSWNDMTDQTPPPHVFSLLAMWNVLRILLHRPLVAEGHLHLASPSIAKTSFAACTEAATKIVEIVRLYDRAFSIRRAPYLISYATYVAATIHVRIAATRGSASEAHECLRTCLSVFNQNSETNHAVRKASVVIQSLMKRMNVDMLSPSTDQSSSVAAPAAPETRFQLGHNIAQEPITSRPETGSLINPEPTMIAGQFAPDLDVDTIIHSFIQEQQMNNVVAPVQMPTTVYNDFGPPLPNYGQAGDLGFDDTLFGFNTSEFDWFYPQMLPPNQGGHM